MNDYPRETTELVEFEEVLVNGAPSVAYVWQVRPDHERPSMVVGDWSAPVDLGGGQLGFMLQPAARGTYRVWVKVTSGGQTIVICAGEVERT